MKVNEELSILCWLNRSKGSNDGLAPIYVRITVNGKRENFSSGRKIDPYYWNEETGLAVRACPNQREINTYITKTKVDLERHYNQLLASGINVTAEMVRNAYKPKESDQRTLIDAFKLHNDEFSHGTDFEPST